MKSDWRGYLIQYKVQQHRIIKTFELFRKYNVEPILIKGWAAARNYPQKEDRLFVDIDICVAPNEFKQAEEILADYNKEGLTIDLHNGLRHLDTVEWNDLFENTELVKLETTNIRLLRPEDHLRILCVHWLSDGGANKIKLWDIYYAVKNRPVGFDWERCLNEISPTRRKWIICTVGLACKYLGLNVKDTPIAKEVKDIPCWLIKAVEKEWKSDLKLIPLHYFLHDKKKLLRQIKKRIPPNPIQATIDMEGEFDNRPRIFYQIGDVFFRLAPAVRRIAKSLISQKKVNSKS
jgi:hypothetical protein